MDMITTIWNDDKGVRRVKVTMPAPVCAGVRFCGADADRAHGVARNAMGGEVDVACVQIERNGDDAVVSVVYAEIS